MLKTLNTRSLYFLGFCFCLIMMAYALYAEYQLLLTPCPLCVLQRIAVSITGIIFLAAAIQNPKKFTLNIYTVILTFFSLSGAGIAGWHIWLQNLPADKVPSCGPGFDYIIGNFPLSDALLLIFSGSGECASIDWSFMMLSMPSWVLVCCLGLSTLSIYIRASASNK